MAKKRRGLTGRGPPWGSEGHKRREDRGAQEGRLAPCPSAFALLRAWPKVDQALKQAVWFTWSLSPSGPQSPTCPGGWTGSGLPYIGKPRLRAIWGLQSHELGAGGAWPPSWRKPAGGKQSAGWDPRSVGRGRSGVQGRRGRGDPGWVWNQRPVGSGPAPGSRRQSWGPSEAPAEPLPTQPPPCPLLLGRRACSKQAPPEAESVRTWAREHPFSGHAFHHLPGRGRGDQESGWFTTVLGMSLSLPVPQFLGWEGGAAEGIIVGMPS